MKMNELRQKNASELEQLLQEKKETLCNLNFNLAGGKVKNIKDIRAAKKDIARILTLINAIKTTDAEKKSHESI